MTAPGDRYLHGTLPEEQQRLSSLNEILNQASLDALRLVAGEGVVDPELRPRPAVVRDGTGRGS